MGKITKLVYGSKAKLLDKKVVKAIIAQQNRIVERLNTFETCPGCGGLIDSETNYPCGDSRTYSWTVECKNCYEDIEVKIPFGVEVNDFIKSHLQRCPKCGCSMKLGPEYGGE